MTECFNFRNRHNIVISAPPARRQATAGIQLCAVHTKDMEKQGYVYILASGRNATLYIGVTSDLVKRIYQHRTGTTPGFTSRYDVTRLVHYEIFGDMDRAIAREKTLKKWRRAWKLKLIERENPDWRDLYPEITGFPL